jgi:hypothetical protein
MDRTEVIMSKVVFFRQRRYDLAIRTGIRLDDVLIAHRFERASEEPDPSLLWYLDVRCRGDAAPTRREEVVPWLVKISNVVCGGMVQYADQLGACDDSEDYPLEWGEFPDAPAGLAIKIVCSAVQGTGAREMEEIVRSIAEDWEAILGGLRTWKGKGERRETRANP